MSSFIFRYRARIGCGGVPCSWGQQYIGVPCFFCIKKESVFCDTLSNGDSCCWCRRGGVFYVLPILFGDCFEFVCSFCPAAEVTTTTEAEYGVIVI